jgi:hypothetical protein
MGSNQSSSNQTIKEIAPGFYNVRASFPKFAGLVDIGTHMSMIKLSNGKFLVIDTVPLNHDLKLEIDNLTDNGKNIEAVVGSHPFHTLAFPTFYNCYPNSPYYGTPRHLRKLTEIPWTGSIKDNLKKWEPDVQMRIPEGAEFDDPQPESYNHFSCVWVYSPAAKTVHVDDTINYFGNPPVLVRLAGKKKGSMEFHDSIKGPGLYKTSEAPDLFKNWLLNIIQDWDFDNMCCAHLGNKIGGAKDLLSQVLADAQPLFDAIKHVNHKTEQKEKETGECSDDGKDCANYNVEGCECG